MSQVEQALTLEAFLKRPETEPASEYVDGKVVQKVSPKGKHSFLQGAFAERLNMRGRPTRQGLAFPELRCTFEGRSLVYDVAYFQWRRVPFDPNGEVPDDFFLPPDLAVEIVSPGQRVRAVAQKLRWSVAHGVTFGWLIDPRRREVEVYRLGQAPESLAGDGLLELPEVLKGFSCSADELFAWLRPGG